MLSPLVPLNETASTSTSARLVAVEEHSTIACAAREIWSGPRKSRAIRDRRMRDLALTIAQQPDNWPRVRQKIDEIGLSAAYLSVRFKESVGLPMRSYALWMKFEHACELVLSGKCPSDAATEAGFADQSHLGRAARRFAHKSFWRAIAELRAKLDPNQLPVKSDESSAQKSSSAGPSSTNPS